MAPVVEASAVPGSTSAPSTASDARAGAAAADIRAADTEEQAAAQAERTGEPVEIASLRGESSDVFATPEGNLEAREYLRPVRTRVGGKWKAIDTGLTPAADGMVAPGATTVGMEFSGGGTAPLVRMTKAGRELALSWPGELPQPRLEGDAAVYPEVLPGVDLRMGVQADGFTQLLIVKTAEAAQNPELAQLRLHLDATGMSVRETAAGGLEAVDAGAGGAVFEAPQPVMWDSSGGTTPGARSAAASDPAADEPAAGETGKLAPVDVQVAQAPDQLVLTPDAQVLKGADTVYPVFIDPQWYSPRTSAWTFASKYWASSPQWKFNAENNAGMGYCGWDYCAPHDTKRVFYRIPTSRFAGKSILSAEFVVRNNWSASCSERSVELWRTKGISSSTTWNSQDAGSGFWLDKLDTRSFAYGYDGCAAKDAEFGIKSAVQQAANNKWSTMTFGLRAASEDDKYAWKRFSDKAFLRVKYNRPPPQIKMAQLTMEYGGVCKRPGEKARIRSLGKISANEIRDPDGDHVAVQFQAKWTDASGATHRWSPSRTSFEPSGSSFTVSLPKTGTNPIPKNENVHWYARAYDGAQWSPWSYAGDTKTACYFVWDTNEPAAPTVTSGEYPESDPANPNDPWLDGVGQYGTFTLDSPAADATRYLYGINGDPVPGNQISTSGGAARDVKILPTRPGLNFITAQSFDAAGNNSEIRTYQFRVKAGQPDRATWQLDESAGATQAEGSTPARTLALKGGAATGAAGTDGTALGLNGTDAYAATDLSAVNNTGGFTVSAWVKLDAKPTAGAAVVASQPGNERMGFALHYAAAHDRWIFNGFSADTPDATVHRAMAPNPGGVQTGTWTHLVGSYDSVEDKLRLFVDGTLVGETPFTSTWNARRGLQLGAGSGSGVAKDFFPGTLDEVQIFDKRIAQDEVDKLYAKQTIGDPGRPAIAVFELDEPTGATEVSGRGGVLPARYHGGVTTGVPGVAGKATKFNGTDGYARIGQTSGPHINSERSFAVSAWAKLDAKPDRQATVVAQAGEFALGFELYYSAAYDRWVFNQYASDTPGAPIIRAMADQPGDAYAGTWAHLVGVHDTTANTLTLYINGKKAGSTTLVDAFYAAGSMYVGAVSVNNTLKSHFPGTIDDIRLFDRPISPAEVQQLYKQRAFVKGRWLFEEVSDSAPATTPDASGEGRPMTLEGGAKLGAGWIDFSGLQLDGVDDHAAASMPVDTSGSFTLTGWAQAAAMPGGAVTVASAEGSATNAFSVRYLPDAADPNAPGRWQVVLPSSDAADAPVVRADNGNFYDVREWNHLALVYDGFARELKLYVNGVLEETACSDSDGDGEPDQAGCKDLVPWAEHAQSFKATGELQIGRAKTVGGFDEYFPGTIDDVWAFQGPLSEDQVAWLASQWFDVPTQVPPGG
ncbi:LamG-like jellyroll fold domain-containing protein [Streptomyces sp. MAR4 CNY-716]